VGSQDQEYLESGPMMAYRVQASARGPNPSLKTILELYLQLASVLAVLLTMSDLSRWTVFRQVQTHHLDHHIVI
jgi:hypothetical protein